MRWEIQETRQSVSGNEQWLINHFVFYVLLGISINFIAFFTVTLDFRH